MKFIFLIYLVYEIVCNEIMVVDDSESHKEVGINSLAYGDNIQLPVKSQQESENMNHSNDFKKVFLFKDTDFYGYVHISGLRFLTVKYFVFTNLDKEKLKNGFYLGFGLGEKMAGNSFMIVKFYNPSENLWDCFDYYAKESNPRAVNKSGSYKDPPEPDEVINNVTLDIKAWFENLDPEKFNYKHLIYAEFSKNLDKKNEFDSPLLNNFNNDNTACIGAFGPLRDKEPFYHYIRNKASKTFVAQNSNNEIINSGFIFDNKSFKIQSKPHQYTILYEQENKSSNKKTVSSSSKELQISYISDSNYNKLPYDNFIDMMNYKKQANMQIYLIADGFLTPDVFMFSTFENVLDKNKKKILRGKTYILDTFDAQTILERGFQIGILLGSRTMKSGDFVVLKFEGTILKEGSLYSDESQTEKSRWSLIDGFVDPNSKRKIHEDSYFKLRNAYNATLKAGINDDEFDYEQVKKDFPNLVPNLTDYNNVKLLRGENVSPVIFKLDDTENLFGKFKNLIAFQWEKNAENPDEFDWADIFEWNENNGFVGGGYVINNPDGYIGYHHNNRAGDANFEDGNGLRSNTLEIYEMLYLSSFRINFSLFCLTLLYLTIF